MIYFPSLSKVCGVTCPWSWTLQSSWEAEFPWHSRYPARPSPGCLGGKDALRGGAESQGLWDGTQARNPGERALNCSWHPIEPHHLTSRSVALGDLQRRRRLTPSPRTRFAFRARIELLGQEAGWFCPPSQGNASRRLPGAGILGPSGDQHKKDLLWGVISLPHIQLCQFQWALSMKYFIWGNWCDTELAFLFFISPPLSFFPVFSGLFSVQLVLVIM